MAHIFFRCPCSKMDQFFAFLSSANELGRLHLMDSCPEPRHPLSNQHPGSLLKLVSLIVCSLRIAFASTSGHLGVPSPPTQLAQSVGGSRWERLPFQACVQEVLSLSSKGTQG